MTMITDKCVQKLFKSIHWLGSHILLAFVFVLRGPSSKNATKRSAIHRLWYYLHYAKSLFSKHDTISTSSPCLRYEKIYNASAIYLTLGFHKFCPSFFLLSHKQIENYFFLVNIDPYFIKSFKGILYCSNLSRMNALFFLNICYS